jgi:RIO kinase 1
VLLMELVLDLEGHPAPRLEEAALTPEEASALYFDLRNQAIRMLCCDIIHGDLSAFNILLGNRGATIIDFPQVVDAAANSQAESYFKRDIENLRRYFELTDPSLRARAGDAQEIWRAYTKRELTPDYVPTGRFQGEPRGEQRRSSGGPRTFNNGPGERSGNGRPQGDRFPRGDRPQGERFPRGDRPQGERPQGDRPQGDRFPRGERPQGDRPPREGQRQWADQGARPSGPPPQQQGPREMRAREDRPPRGDRPQGERFPRGERPQGDRFPRGERPQGERPPRGNAEAQRPWSEQGARPSGQQGPREPRPQGRPPERRNEGPGGRGGPRQGRSGGGGGPAVSYSTKAAPVAPASPPKSEDES